MGTEHRLKFAALHQQWCCLQMSEKFSNGTKTSPQTNKQTNKHFTTFKSLNAICPQHSMQFYKTIHLVIFMQLRQGSFLGSCLWIGKSRARLPGEEGMLQLPVLNRSLVPLAWCKWLLVLAVRRLITHQPRPRVTIRFVQTQRPLNVKKQTIFSSFWGAIYHSRC